MSRQTPRKARHSRQPSNRIPAVSDYESDAAAIHADYAPPPPRTNTELNLSVLQRYLPSIHTILSIAANAVIYTFNSASESWEKSGVEGTMFVCAQSPLPEDPGQRARACVFVLNRRGLDNLIVDLSRVTHAEVSGELVIMKVEGEWQEGDKVLGVWIHNDKDETREVNAATIQEARKIAQSVSSKVHQKSEAEESKSERSKESRRSEVSTRSGESKKSKISTRSDVSVRSGGSTLSRRSGKRGKPFKLMKVKAPEDSDTEKSESGKSESGELERVQSVYHIPESEKSESPGSESEVDTEYEVDAE
ncbi:Dcp1-like decapping protein [Fusarium napiforme]|uniref:Dcp1-like decapping protein n=1 Tax=Fusarium napiforme TaxID=42672 RepID=A0A8H5JN62_9HYPO|nr:Dcp1-like decapping protein [Fusarium napiforme]